MEPEGSSPHSQISPSLSIHIQLKQTSSYPNIHKSPSLYAQTVQTNQFIYQHTQIPLSLPSDSSNKPVHIPTITNPPFLYPQTAQTNQFISQHSQIPLPLSTLN